MAICIEMATPTVLPGTTKTQINGGSDLVLPADVRSIVAIIPVLAVDAGITAAKAKIAKCTIESDDLPGGVAPLEVLCNPIGTGVDEIPASFSDTPQKYAVNIPCMGGERVRIYGTNLQDPTTDPMMSCALVLSTRPPTAPQVHGKVGDLTATSGTTAVSASAGTVTLAGAHRLKEVMGLIVMNAATTLEGFSAILELQSSEFVPNLPVRFPCSPLSGGIVPTTDVHICDLIAGLLRMPVDIGLKSPATIESFGTVYASTITSAPFFATGFLYE